MSDYEFDNKNGEFTLYNPETGKNWYNQLWNDYGYHMSVTHRVDHKQLSLFSGVEFDLEVLGHILLLRR